MQITSKGQVTIPKAFRDHLGLFPYMNVEFIMKNGRLYLEKAKAKKRDKLSLRSKAILNMVGKGKWKMTTDEIMALTRGDD